MISYPLKHSPIGIKQDARLILLIIFTLGVVMDASCTSTSVSTQALELTQIVTATPGIPTITPTPNTTYDFKELIGMLEDTMPGPFSEGFVIPQEADKNAFHIITLSMIDDNNGVSFDLASEYGYETLSLFDQGDSMAESYVLVEQPPIERGWGLYFFRKSFAQNIVLEAPHPVADENTPTVALDLYRALKAKALLVAGAHRDANLAGTADPTHSVDTIFQVVHTSLFKPAGQADDKVMFIQLHGYSAEEHPNAPQVVIGYDWKNDPEKDLSLARIVDALHENDITVGVCQGRKYQGLCGTSNVQRQEMDGGIFIHMELSKTIRRDDRGLVAALQQALNP
jgi:hypothetical protein